MLSFSACAINLDINITGVNEAINSVDGLDLSLESIRYIVGSNDIDIRSQIQIYNFNAQEDNIRILLHNLTLHFQTQTFKNDLQVIFLKVSHTIDMDTFGINFRIIDKNTNT